MYTKMQSLYYSFCDSVGFVPNKDGVVSQAYWEKRAKTNIQQDLKVDETYERSLSSIGNELNRLEWNSLLEVGCGFGRVLRFLSDKFPEKKLSGLDFSGEQLKHARTYVGDRDIRWYQGDTAPLPFGENVFDVVITSAMLIYTHPNDLQRTLSEFKRVAKKYVLLFEYDAGTIDTPERRALLTRAPFYGHDYAAALRQTGFRVKKAERLPEWNDQPGRLPLTCILAEKTDSAEGTHS